MSNSERKILNLIYKKKTIYKKELESNVKSKNVPTLIKWLIEENYIKKDTSIGKDEILTLTKPGIEYKQNIDKLLLKKYLVRLGIPAALLATITILSIIFKPFGVDNQSKSENKSIIVGVKDMTFCIKDYNSFKGLVDSIENRSNFVNNPSSKRIFEITYSGELMSIRANYYHYPGGNLVIKLNGNVVLDLDSIKIEKTNPDGTLKNEITEELKRRVAGVVVKNDKLIIKEMISIMDK